MKMQLAFSAVTGIVMALMSSNSYSNCTTTCDGMCGIFDGAEMDACFQRRRECLDSCMQQYNQPRGSSSYSGRGYSPGFGYGSDYSSPALQMTAFCITEYGACEASYGMPSGSSRACYTNDGYAIEGIVLYQ